MPDNPRIELEYDPSPVIQGTREANKALESTEKTTNKVQENIEKKTQETASGILRVVSTSSRSTQNMLSQAERRLAALKSPQDLLRTRQEIELKKSDPISKNRLLEIHAEENAILKQRELAEATAEAERQAAKEAERQAAALAKAAEEAKQLRDNTVASTERRALSTQSPLTRLGVERTAALASVAGDPAAIDRVTASYDRLIAVEKQQLALRTADEFGRIGKALTIGVTLPMTAAGLAALHSSEQYNKATAALTQMLGSAEQAKRFLGELQQFALTTPFEFAELVPAAQRLKALGFEAKSIIPIMRAVGEATAATGGNGETFDRITLALGQIQSKGRVMAQEMNQLTEALVPAWDILAKKIGVSIPEAMKMAENGAISASVAVPAILQGMLQRYAGQMQQQNQLLSGQFSNLKDKIGFLLRDVGNALTPLAKTMVDFGASAVTSLSKAVQWFNLMPTPIQYLTIGLASVLALLGPVTTAASAAAKAMALLWGAQNGQGFTGTLGVLRQLPAAFSTVAAGATGMSAAIAGLNAPLLLLGQGIVIVTAALASFKLGQWIDSATGWGQKIADVANGVLGVASSLTGLPLDRYIEFGKTAEVAAEGNKELEFQANKAYESLKKLGVVIPRNGQSLEDWNKQLQQTVQTWGAIQDMARRAGAAQADAATEKELKTAAKRSADILRQAQLGELSGLERNREKYQQYREELHLTDAEVKKLSGSQLQAAEAARQSLAQAELIDAQKIARKTLTERALATAEMNAQEQKAAQLAAIEREKQDRESIKDSQARALDLRDLKLRNAAAEYGLQEKYLTASRDSELRNLQQVNAVTIDQKIAVEQKKAEIEQRYLQQTLDVKKKLLEADKAIEIAHATGTEAEKAAQVAAINDKYRISEKALVLDTDAEIRAAQENAAIQSNQIIRDQNQKTYDHFKSEAERTIDAVGRLWTSGFSGMARSMKLLLLSAFKDVLSSQIARFLYQASGGGPVSFARGATGGSGFLGKISSWLGLGAIPVLGAGSITGGPGGTSGFTGSVNQFSLPTTGPASTVGTVAASTAGAKASTAAVAGYTAQFKSYKDLLAQLGNLWKGHGIGGATGGGLLLGGGLLAFDGIRRGGLTGFGETTAGGALIGAKFGGLIGALIGAGIGAIAGLVGLFRTSAEEKIVKAVKRLYGFEIEKSFAKNSLLPIIQQQFGGDIEAGLRAQQVRELIQLYAMSKGLSTQGILPQATPSVFASTGGNFVQVPTFQNGSPVLAGSAQSVSAAAPSNVTVQMDGPTTQRFLQGQAVQAMAANPRATSRSATKGQVQRGSRQSMASQLQPNFIV